MGVPQTKLLHGFSPNFQGMITLSGSRADKIFGGYPVTTVAMVTLLIFSGLKVLDVSQPKLLHEFSNFQDMFTPRGSTAD